jgi:protein involved in polysaccharide export with SLBB domain
VLPYGAKFGQLMQHIQFSANSDQANLQLYRTSVKNRQRVLLEAALKNLENSVLTARSATNEESRLRKDEAELMLQWVERAKKIEPRGQVVIARAEDRNNLLLENGDVVRIPKNDSLVLVSGEVVFPNAIVHDGSFSVEDYIKASGGYSQSADSSRVIIAHRDGTFEDIQGERNFWSTGTAVRASDEILVLPLVKTKSIEVTRAISQILYQFAIVTKVVFGL